MRRRVAIGLLAVLIVCPAVASAFSLSDWLRPAPVQDEAVLLLLDEITRRQPEPYGLPEDSTSNYWWAQNMMAFVAAERCGYMERDEAVARLKGMLDAIEPLERHYGFSYDSYDLTTGKKTTDKIYFQGWWLFALCVVKNAYAELAPQCERLLAEVDYENSGLFNPETRQLAADYWPEEKRDISWIDLYYQPAGEFRTPYVVYSYLTGDLSPWTRWVTVRQIDIEGHPVLGVWHNFVFCSMLVHSVFPDLGYLERSWDELLKGLERYRRENGMTFFPTRAEPLEAWADMGLEKWPNTEHRIAKPWLAWFANPRAPVMEKAFTPGHGVSLYYDNMNFFWSYGRQIRGCRQRVGTDAAETQKDGKFVLPFEVMLLPDRYDVANPPKLTSIKLLAVRGTGRAMPEEPLQIRLNGTPIAEIRPSEVRTQPRLITRTLHNVVLNTRSNLLEISSADQTPGSTYTLCRFENNFWKASYTHTSADGETVEEDVDPPYVEITIEGQHDGGENPYALLARCAAVHDYYVWHEMLNDETFLDRTVAWVGDYYDRVRLARVVHNISDENVSVHYERPGEWTEDASIEVLDITEEPGSAIPFDADSKGISWEAEPRHTYRVKYGEKTPVGSDQESVSSDQLPVISDQGSGFRVRFPVRSDQ